MDSITRRTVEHKDEWENFLATHPEANFLQSWYWGDFHTALGHSVYRTGFYKGEVLVGVMLSVVEDARRGRYLTIPGGPIMNWDDSALVESFVVEVKKLSKTYACVFARVRPQLESTEKTKALFKKLGFRSSPTHLHAELTLQLDITETEEKLLANMRKATRYEIKKAQKLGVTVTATDDPKSLRTFYDTQLNTAQRQKFVPFTYEYLYEQFKVFADAGRVLLFTAAYGDEVLAQAFVIFYGREAAYHYGASTDAGRKYPGAYLAQWEAIREAKKRGLSVYNFWGVSPEGETGHRFEGLSKFKRGFGGNDFEYLHAHDLVMKPIRYFAVLLVETIRQKMRRL